MLLYYIISEPTREELNIKGKLISRYGKRMPLRLRCISSGLKRGDYFQNFDDTMYMYLGHPEASKDISIYLKFNFHFKDKVAERIDKVEAEGLYYNNFLKYLNSEISLYSLVLEENFDTSKIFNGLGREYVGHIDIKISNKEICNIIEKL